MFDNISSIFPSKAQTGNYLKQTFNCDIALDKYILDCLNMKLVKQTEVEYNKVVGWIDTDICMLLKYELRNHQRIQ